MSDTGREEIALHAFTAVDGVEDLGPYVQGLEAFDRLPLLGELKALAIERTRTGPGSRVLDVGCGFGLETLRLAEVVGPTGAVTGIDSSARFVAEAQRRAAGRGNVGFRHEDAQRLPFADAAFDVVRAERVLVYVDDPARALDEMVRVTRPGGAVALIMPDFETNTVNVPDPALTRAVLAHEADTSVPNARLSHDVRALLVERGLRNVQVGSRMVVFDPDLAATYFAGVGESAGASGVVAPDRARWWVAQVAELHAAGRLWAAIGYYLFTADVP
ncbi:methyltransferase domain-containing protein [Pseudonocardia pini]|uniref:methyltransferase domain-containing protein n=1 Tax=Pseudonocardia pini TaxID=2758030 RepID=UPI0015F0AB50|nr:methyltransferase domain-containing protein [Pseudonocardia pini]